MNCPPLASTPIGSPSKNPTGSIAHAAFGQINGREGAWAAMALVVGCGPATATPGVPTSVIPTGPGQTGAQGWSSTTRLEFANDPLELLAVDGTTNEDKGDGDAATWLPPNKPFRCAYVSRQVAVKVRYHLWVTAAERAELGITDNTLRLSVGIEDPDDIIADIEQALAG